LLELKYGGQTVEEAASAYERVAGRVCLKALRPEQLLYLGEYGPSGEDLFHQSVVDRTLAFLGILVLLPVILAAALAVRLSSAGPVLNRRTRIGLNGKPFALYKFRCMAGPAGEADIWASKDDPRVTKVGWILRTSRVDELPQLLNVLRGEMAIVGPRAERPEFVKRMAELIPCYPQRHLVRPGITGWAQMNQEEGVVQDAITRLEYDLYYIKNMSFSLDTFILAHSLKEVVLSRGAD
jgi:lipopolysaccharide/colanic/teichoic acid biosynthesis glycosyltransferase